MTKLQKLSFPILIAVLLGYPAYMWWNGDRAAQDRCRENSMKLLVAAFDVKALTSAPLGFISAKAYKNRAIQCSDSLLWDAPFWTDI